MTSFSMFGEVIAIKITTFVHTENFHANINTLEELLMTRAATSPNTLMTSSEARIIQHSNTSPS